MTIITVTIAEDGKEPFSLMFKVDATDEGQWIIDHERQVKIRGEEEWPEGDGELVPYLTGRGKFHLGIAYNEEIRVRRAGRAQA